MKRDGNLIKEVCGKKGWWKRYVAKTVRRFAKILIWKGN